jgi:hypothetical protein
MIRLNADLIRYYEASRSTTPGSAATPAGPAEHQARALPTAT